MPSLAYKANRPRLIELVPGKGSSHYLRRLTSTSTSGITYTCSGSTSCSESAEILLCLHKYSPVIKAERKMQSGREAEEGREGGRRRKEMKRETEAE